MSIDWKNTTKLLLRAIIVLAILTPIAYLFSVRPAILLIVTISLVGLWEKRKQLSSTVKRAKVIIGVVFGTALIFGFLLWYINGDTSSALNLVLGITAVIILSLGFYN